MEPGVLRTMTAERIAILKPSALGDVVQTLPLLPALRQRFPKAKLTWVIQKELQDLVRGHPCLDAVLPIERRPTLRQAGQLLVDLIRAEFDLVFDLQGLLRSGVMVLATAAPYRVGLETAREGSHLFSNLTIPETGRAVPAHARYWRVAEALGVGDVPRECLVWVSAGDVKAAADWLDGRPRPWIGVQWGAQWETKRWPIAGLATVVARAQAVFGGTAFFVGGKGDRAAGEEFAAAVRQQSNFRLAATNAEARRAVDPVESAQLTDTVKLSEPVVNLAGQTSIKQLAAVLSRLDLMLSNDSGPLHLAAELGTPSVGVFTCTSPVRSGPPGQQHRFVTADVPCAASYCKVCPKQGPHYLACHRVLTADGVYPAVAAVLDAQRATRGGEWIGRPSSAESPQSARHDSTGSDRAA